MSLLRFICFVLTIFAFGYISIPANATVVFTASGTSSKGVAVSFEAALTVSGDTLTVQLINNSPVSTLNPSDALSSFYFDILDAAKKRPTLTFASAVGDVYLASKNNPDTLQATNANIQASSFKDGKWAFGAMDAKQTPFLGFGIGTVGNSNLAPNNFNGNIVSGKNYSIYKGDITTQNLNGQLLVKDTATFMFTGLTGFTEGDVVPKFAFGLGTAPDSFLTPEPMTLLLLGLGAIMLRNKKLRSKGINPDHFS